MNVSSKETINILSILFDSKLQRKQQVTKSIREANTCLHGIRIIRKYFNQEEVRNMLVTMVMMAELAAWSLHNLRFRFIAEEWV